MLPLAAPGRGDAVAYDPGLLRCSPVRAAAATGSRARAPAAHATKSHDTDMVASCATARQTRLKNVFLEVAPEVIFERLSANPEEIKKRPLLQGGDALEKLNEIREKRLNLYNPADVKVSISKDLSIDQVDELVVNTVLETIKANPPQWMTWKQNKEKEMQNNLFKDDTDNVLQ